jgi:hypothetical protein
VLTVGLLFEETAHGRQSVAVDKSEVKLAVRKQAHSARLLELVDLAFAVVALQKKK